MEASPLLYSSSQATTSAADDDGIIVDREGKNSTLMSSEILIGKWKDQEDGALLLKSLQYLDVATLIQKVKPVSKNWQNLGIKAIDNKCIDKKKFQSNNELWIAVNKYSPGTYDDNTNNFPPTDAEDIATTYGYPIDKWDVSNVKGRFISL